MTPISNDVWAELTNDGKVRASYPGLGGNRIEVPIKVIFTLGCYWI